MRTQNARSTVQQNAVSKTVRTAATFASLVVGFAAQASTDYGPAVWRPTCDGEWYTTGYGKKFYVIHDMEGYYLTGISYMNRCDTPVSVHYAVNGKKDVTSDAAPGEVSQLVRDTYYAWHARCWNQHSMGTEHEGFASNPAWYTDEMYDASAALTKSKAEKYGFAKDRNHIVGHDEDRTAAWVAWADTGLGIDPGCNTHHDPGPYWDWTEYMNRITQVPAPFYTFSSSAQGWAAGNGMGGLTWTTSANWPGIIYGDQNGNDSYLVSGATSFSGVTNTVVNVSLQPYLAGNPSRLHDMQFHWKRAGDSSWSSTRSSPVVSYIASNQWVMVNLNVNSPNWTGKTISQLRLDLDSTNSGYRWHINHVVFQTAPRWYFGANAEGWTTGTGMSSIHWVAGSWPGIIYADQTGDDGRFYSPAISFRGAWNDRIRVRVYPQNGTSANHDMQIFFTTTADLTWTSSKSSAVVNYTAQNAWADVYFDIGSNAAWSGSTGPTITQIRVDVDGISSGTRFIIDSVTIE